MSNLVTPDQITSTCLEILRDKHNEHLARFERQMALPPKTIQPLGTIGLLAQDEVRLREQKLPAALLAIALQKAPDRNKNFKLDITWTLTVYVIAAGQNAVDTLKRRDWYAMTVSECLLSRLPRDGSSIDSFDLADMDFQSGKGDTTRYRSVADAEITFNVLVRDSLDLQTLPTADTDIPAGTPGGPPATPYAEPEPWPKANPVGPIDVERVPEP